VCGHTKTNTNKKPYKEKEGEKKYINIYIYKHPILTRYENPLIKVQTNSRKFYAHLLKKAVGKPPIPSVG
jgi:hypothetical protein